MVTKAFEILDTTAYIVYAQDEESALEYFYAGKAVKGDSWPDVRELGRAEYQSS